MQDWMKTKEYKKNEKAFSEMWTSEKENGFTPHAIAMLMDEAKYLADSYDMETWLDGVDLHHRDEMTDALKELDPEDVLTLGLNCRPTFSWSDEWFILDYERMELHSFPTVESWANWCKSHVCPSYVFELLVDEYHYLCHDAKTVGRWVDKEPESFKSYFDAVWRYGSEWRDKNIEI